MHALLRISRVDHTEQQLFAVLQVTLSAAIELTCARKGSLYRKDGKELTCVVAQDDEGNPISSLAGPISFSVARECLSSGEPVQVPVLQAQDSVPDAWTIQSPRSVLCLPISRGEDLLGVVYVDQGPSGGVLTDGDRQTLRLFGEAAGIAISNAEAYHRLLRQVAPIEDTDRFCGLVARDPSMRRIFQRIQQLAWRENAPTVLIRGEIGTGKELIARALHLSSGRRMGRFVPVACAQMASDRLERQLFGQAASVGGRSVGDRLGLFEVAMGGTVFLDDIAELDLDLQGQLLQLLRDKQILPVGAAQPRFVDVWVILATRQDLVARIEKGQFRQDLYDLIRSTTIVVPPLRKRTEDIPLLISAFSGDRPLRLHGEVDGLLRRYSWPGNVRELKSLVAQLCAFSSGPSVVPADLPPEMTGTQSPGPMLSPEDPVGPDREAVIQGFLGSCSLEQVKSAAVEGAVRAQLSEQLLAGAHTLRVNKSLLAEKLGVTRKTVQNLLARYKIDPEQLISELGE